ncbi:MAG: hypothetical protein ACRD09_05965 [Vicinamibacterales bacterium]
MLIGMVAAGILILSLEPSAGQQSVVAPPIDVQTLGPQVGATAPGFSLPDQQGHTRTLQSLLGPKGAVLVFYRSADW